MGAKETRTTAAVMAVAQQAQTLTATTPIDLSNDRPAQETLAFGPLLNMTHPGTRPDNSQP